jgi:putative tricarboxylic transport membrane protein
MVGIDPVIGSQRFTFGNLNLLGGIDVVIVAMGLFGVGEILVNMERNVMATALGTRFKELLPSRSDMKRSAMPIVRGTGIGFLLGLIPGVGAVVPTVLSYVTEKKLSKTPDQFGTGMIEGVAGPETANNAYANSALIPMFTLGIPGSPTVAVIMGAFMMKGLIPGPFLFRDHGDIAWAVIASFGVANLMLLILNLPLIPLWVKLLKIPTSILYTFVLGFCAIGAYTSNGQFFDVGLMAFFGVVGYIFKKIDVPLAPMILTIILGPLMEQSLRQSLEMSRGSFWIFIEHPIALGFILVALTFVLVSTFGIASKVRGADSEV